MLSPRWRKIWMDLRVNKTRTVLVVLSIVVGIFAIGSISGTSAILNRESSELWAAIDPASGVLGTSIIDEATAAQVAAMPEIASVQLRRSFDATVAVRGGGTVDLRLFAVPDYEAMNLNVIQTERGVWPPADGDILIERSTLDLLETSVGQPLIVQLPTGDTQILSITGEAYDLSQPSGTVLNIAYGYVTMDTMNTLTEQDGYNQVQFLVSENADDEAYISEVANMLRDALEAQGNIVFNVTVLPPGEPPGYAFVVALLLVLGVVGSLTFVLSGFLIVNIISALLAQQTMQIGVMKAVGARTGQIVRMYLGLALAFGGIALFFGLPLSLLGAYGLTTFIGDLNNYKIQDFSAPWWVFVLQVVIGLVVPVLAALIPVYAGTRTSVREALDSRGIDSDSTGLINRFLARLHGLPRPVLLSFRNTFRQRGRLLLTLMTLTLAGAIFATVFTVRNSLYATLDDALGYSDFDTAFVLNDAYPRDEVLAAVNSVNDVTAAEAWTQATGRYILADGNPTEDINLVGLVPDTQMLTPIIEAGRWLQPDDTNAIVINGNLRDAIGDNITVGETVTLIVRGQASEWQVVGVAKAVFNLENEAYMPYETLAATIGEAGQARAVRVITTQHSEVSQDATVEAVNTALNRVGYAVEASETRSALESELDLRFNTLVFSLLALAGLLAIVGGLGIAGSTSINVIERMREIGVMRSIGALDYQVLGIFVIEAVFVGILGWFFGSLLALPISRALSDGVGLAFSNAPLTYSFDVSGALLWLVLAMVLAVLSSYFPARRASKLTLREVLAYEG